jgi:hypothetical protein
VLIAIAGESRPLVKADQLEVEVGRVTAQVAGCTAALQAEPVPAGAWAAMTRYAQGMGPLEDAVLGRSQSTHLDHLLAEDWGVSLVPRPGQIRRTCTCDRGGGCEHVAAAGVAFADEIDSDASALLVWRGCVEGAEPAVDERDPWVGGELPPPGPPRAMPVGAVLKRLGPSGIRVGDGDLVDVLQRAYEAFAAGK